MLFMDNILFVTAFKDINRGNWDNIYKRTLDEYMECFIKLVDNIKYKLLVYVEDDIYNNIIKLKLNSNIEIIDSKNINLFFHHYLNDYKSVMSSEIYKNKLDPERSDNPEFVYPEYNLINHSKINFVKYSKNLYPNYKYYSWIDFGCIRDIKNVPNNIDFNKLNDKIVFQCINYPDIVLNPDEMLRFEYIFLAGSQFILPNNLVEIYENLYENKLIEMLQNYVCDDDQSVVLQIYYENSQLFTLCVNPIWFTLFSEFYNS